MNIILIHGANASNKSFALIVRELKKLNNKGINFCYFSYDHKKGFAYNFPIMCDRLSEIEGDCIVIGHSMGGIYATHLYKQFSNKIKTGITIATPYLGLGSALVTRWIFPFWQLLQDVSPTAYPVLAKQQIKFGIPWIQLVPTKGRTPWVSPFQNDGVVSNLSMTYRTDVEYRYINSNHYESLVDYKTTEIVNDTVKLWCC